MNSNATYKMDTRLILVVLTAGLSSLLEILDASIVNVAIPTMMGNIGATLDEISWVTTGYMIANSIVLPIAAWLGTKFGRKKYFTGAILLFTLSSFLCGLAPNLYILIFFRIVQGMAGGALLPTSQALIQESFPPEKAGMAQAIFGLSVIVGPALGPILGGYLTDTYGWRSIFYVNVPLGLTAATLAWANVTDLFHNKAEGKSKRDMGVDWWGLLFLCVGVGCMEYVLARGETDGWMDSNAIKMCLVLAVLGTAAFIYWELKVENAIMNLRLFKVNVLRSGTVLMLTLGIVLYSLNFAMPIFVAHVIPLMTATGVGFLFMPGALTTAAFMLPAGFLTTKVNLRLMILYGFMMAGIAVFIMARFTTETSGTGILIPLILRGAGMAFLFIPINQMVLGEFRGEQLAQVAGMQNFFRQLGGSIGIASLDTLLTRFGAQHYTDLMSHVSALNPMAYRGYMQAMSLQAQKMTNHLGMWDPRTAAVKMLSGRVWGQVFVMSFDQLCWVMIGLVVLGVIPLAFVKTSHHPGQKPAPLGH